MRDRPPASFTAVGAAPEALAAARFTRTLDLAWRRTSYSALTAGVHGGHAGVVTEPEVREKDDEGRRRTPTTGRRRRARVAAEPAGATDATAPDAVTVPGTASATGRSPSPPRWRTCPSAPRSARWCTPCSRPPTSPQRTCAPSCCAASAPSWTATPLRPSTPTRWPPRSSPSPAPRSARWPPAAASPTSRPRTGSPSWTSSCRWPAATPPAPDVRLGDLVPLLRRHLPPGDPLRAYPDALAPLRPPSRCAATSPAASTRCCGCAVPSGSRSSTTRPTGSARSGPDGREPLTAAHYTPPRLAEAMIAAHYPLQALLYAVALHRFLRWRLPRATTRSATSAACSTCSCAACAGRTPRSVDGVPVRGLLAGGRPRRWSSSCPDLLDRGAP